MPTYRGGRHEHGQNYLTNRTIIAQFVGLVADTRGPIIEIGPGRGALTREFQKLRRPITAIEIDAAAVATLHPRLSVDVDLINADFLTWRLPTTPHVVVGNLPFHLTTAILRKLLHASGWTDAVLLVQWEVARRRAGIGGASMMTAQWWPWVEFSAVRRVPASALRPSPSVDGGLLVMSKREEPLLDPKDRGAYRQFVHAVFTGKGNGVAAILARLVEQRRRTAVGDWLARAGVASFARPKDLTATQWAYLFRRARDSGLRLPGGRST